MSSTSGLSSNTSNNNPNNPMKLDAATRESIQAQSQARILAGVLGSKRDSFNSGGGLNPLKGLYSAAAATFLKNKQDRQGAGSSEQKKGSFESSVTAVKKLETQSASSGESWQNTNPKVSGPASGGDYKKYQWTGKPGPTGSDKLEESMPVEEAAPKGDIDAVFASISQVINDNKGKINDDGDGSNSFSVLDLTGSISVDDGAISGFVKTDKDLYTFTVDENGSASIDASQGDKSSAEFEQLQGLLAGSLEGVSRKDDAPAEAVVTEPAAVEPEEAQPAAVTPEEQAAIDQAAADKAAADKAAADKAAADKAAADKAAADAAAAAKAAAAKAAADAAAATAANTGTYKNSAELMKAFLTEIKSRGGSSVNSNGDETTRVSFKGMTGDVEERSDEIRGELSFGTGSVEFRMNLSGEITRFKSSGFTLLKTADIAALKDSLSKLNRTGVNVVA